MVYKLSGTNKHLTFSSEPYQIIVENGLYTIFPRKIDI